MNATIKLTQFSHGAGCGCKIAPKTLEQILAGNFPHADSPLLLVGNGTRDDAAVYDMGHGTALISTTDFFTPIVDDAYDYGRIAAANAISDVYAMGGRPILAIAILGWPVNVLPAELARRVLEGGRNTCMEAGIPLAGGHSIDCPEPVFGLAVNGIIDIRNIKQNNTAKAGDLLFLTKRLGIGILTTAEKKGILQQGDYSIATDQMVQLNKVGESLGKIEGVSAMTDVTGFGLLGHLVEICEGSGLGAELYFDKIPLLTDHLGAYIKQGSIPGGTNRNWDSYGAKISILDPLDKAQVKALLADPQTNGGLLISVSKNAEEDVHSILQAHSLYDIPIGKITERKKDLVTVH